MATEQSRDMDRPMSEAELRHYRRRYHCTGMAAVRLEFLLTRAPGAARKMAAEGTLDRHTHECAKRYAAKTMEILDDLLEKQGIDQELRERDMATYQARYQQALLTAQEIAREQVVESL